VNRLQPPRNAHSWILNAEHSIRTWLDTSDPNIFPDAWYIASCTCGWHAASQNAGLRNWNADGHASDVQGHPVTLPGDKGPYL